jgi:stage II sporulation protein R
MFRNTIKGRLIVSLSLLGTGVIFGLILLALGGNLRYDKAYAENLIRLHVIANSNSPQDQDLKLIVRNEVLKEAEQILEDIDDKQGAYLALRKNAERLEGRAQQVVASAGFAYPVEVKMGQFPFPYREYGSMSLPEGLYDAVRIEIGTAQGDNWWCVLFPPLCLAELEEMDQSLVTIDENASNDRRFVFRFKLWEQMAETRYARALQKWWQASAAGFPALSD